MLSDPSSLYLLESLCHHARSRQDLLGRLLPTSLRRSSLSYCVLDRYRLHQPVHYHHPVLDHIRMHSNPIVLGQRHQGTVSGRRRNRIREQRPSNRAGLNHFDHAHARSLGLTDETVAQGCSRVHVCDRSLVS